MRWLVGMLLLLSPRAGWAQSYQQLLAAEIEQLSTEKKSLEKALAEEDSSVEAAARALRRDIERLTGELSAARAANAERAQDLPNAERIHSLEDQARRTVQLTDQIRAWLSAHQVEFPEAAPIQALVERALAHVEAQGQLRAEESEYFDQTGLARTGPVLRVAQVAAVVMTDPPRALVRAADGSLRTTQGVEAGAGLLAEGRSVGVVLFDPLESHTPQSYHQETFLDWMRRGGAIMWPLLLLAVIGLLLSIERAQFLLRAGARVARFRRNVRSGGTPNADTHPLIAPLLRISPSTASNEVLENEVAEGLMQAKPTLRRGVSFLGITAAVAPLIGLLGTVTGMIRTFAIITEHGTGDPRLLSAGISEALLTTQLGLMVAVPALLLHTALLRWGHVVLSRAERLAIELIAARKKDDHE